MYHWNKNKLHYEIILFRKNRMIQMVKVYEISFDILLRLFIFNCLKPKYHLPDLYPKLEPLWEVYIYKYKYYKYENPINGDTKLITSPIQLKFT